MSEWINPALHRDFVAEQTDAIRQSAETAARSAIQQTVLMIVGAAVSLAAGLVLFLVAVSSVGGTALVVLGLIAGALVLLRQTVR